MSKTVITIEVDNEKNAVGNIREAIKLGISETKNARVALMAVISAAGYMNEFADETIDKVRVPEKAKCADNENAEDTDEIYAKREMEVIPLQGNTYQVAELVNGEFGTLYFQGSLSDCYAYMMQMNTNRSVSG